MEIARIDPRGLVFVDEMGAQDTSLAPLYAYAPIIGKRAPSLRSPEKPRQKHHDAA